MNVQQRLGQTIKRLRTQQQLTQEDMAFISGLSLQTISDIENAKYDPLLNELYRIAAVLEMKPSEIVFEMEQEIDLP
ncbi:helix-turn-helix transcriptional regulator [Bacillus sp. ISL-37]|uniref:helix-turn-helix transcriptional regulator n=1 Tax=Bacillus sp. ISL-37 TaxID=2819123 RepID=UPI001BEBD7AC|nr:helix-turn-helix transcriptional regulator [Bacillus sp. ISL-37]MBT2684169.1 helix-turn-helix transcriptional regulator [Bacillus sp. ISL-37]